MSLPQFDAELVHRVIGHLKAGTDPLSVLQGLTPDELDVVKATWTVGGGIYGPDQWDDAVKYSIPAGGRNPAVHMADHELLKRLKVGSAKLEQT